MAKSLYQTKEWAELRKRYGWQAHWIEDILVLEKPLNLGYSFLYSPELEYVSQNLEKIKKNAKISAKFKPVFLRLDFLNEFNEKSAEILKAAGFIKAFEEIQPEWRQIIDITGSEEEILAQMKPKGRYNIRVAVRNGITVNRQPSTNGNIDAFYRLFQETARRDGFSVRPKAYFENLLKVLAPAGFAELLEARYNNKVIAAEIVTYYGETASYLYGASSNEYRNTMAPYLLHWEAIKRAKAKGCVKYDLLAVSPEELSDYSDQTSAKSRSPKSDGRKLSHKYSGITRFKEQFGGRKIHTLGSWDLVYRPVEYKIFEWAEKIRRK